MPLVRWTPSIFDQFDDLFKDMAPLSVGANTMYPALDIYQTDAAVIVEAQLAGVDPEQVDLHIENDVLTLQGTVEKKTEIDEQNYYRKEIRSGSFHRSVALPTAVVSDEANAVYESGVLKITIPKQQGGLKKSIKIAVKK